ncbi:MAG: hypothetical protein KDC76_13660 [Bacteroidetes bacterium]|nr:hypothetical protein [Bacteroidota bacterium]
MIRVSLLAALIALSSVGAMAQKQVISGYLGKRNYASIGMEMGLSQHPQKAYLPGERFDAPDVVFSQDLIMCVGRNLNNKWVAEMNVTFINTSMDVQELTNSASVRINNVPKSVNRYMGTPKVTGANVDLNFKYYFPKYGSLAPIGYYLGLGIGPTFAKSDPSKMELTDYQGTYQLFVTEKTKVQMTNFMFSLGITRAISKSILLDFGTSMNIAWGGANNLDITDDGYRELREQFHGALQHRMSLYSLSNLYLSAGYLF